MKGEFVDHHQENKDSSSMFTKIHLNHPYHHPPPPHAAFHQPLTVAADETDNRSPASPSGADRKEPITPQPVLAAAGNSDGASIEVIRRPRGRPPGSKNKPKPPVIITREAEPSMSPYILEVPAGVDLVDSVTRFCRKRNMGLCVLNGSGTVSNVTLRQPSTTPGATVTFHGRFDILSISATVVPPSASFMYNGFTISLAGPQGQVVGGAVVGPLLSAGTVYLISATFNNPSYYRFPAEDETRNSGGGGSGGSEGGRHPSPQTAVSGGGDNSAAAPESMYSCHLPSSDVIWAPTARQPPPPPPY